MLIRQQWGLLWTIPTKMISLGRKLSVLFTTHAGELNHLYNVGSADGTAYLKLATVRDYDTPTFRVTGERSSSELHGQLFKNCKV
jgi:hypothetical protein